MKQLRWLTACGICLLLLSLSGSFARAVDLHPETKQRLIESGRWEQYKQTVRAARAAGMDQPSARPQAAKLAASATAVFGSRIPCILVDFEDNPWTAGDSTWPGFIDTMLFSEGEYPTGSMREYYLENSYGQFAVTGEVVSWRRMPRTYLYYVGNNAGIGPPDSNSQTLARDAILAADPFIDYSDYDTDGNGVVDGVMIVFAGHGFEEAESEESLTIQSHQWIILSAPTLDGVTFRDYTVQPEEHGPHSGGTNGIGVMCHEWGHILNLPDLYDLDFSSWGVGRWSIMGNGNYLGNSHTPSHFDPWCKVQLGWVNVDTVQANLFNHAIPTFATTPTVFRLWMSGIAGDEYFLVCNRQQTGFDAELPGSGLLILHCDDNKGSNMQEYIPGQGLPTSHYWVAVVQADGDYDLEKYDDGNPGDAGDLYTDKTTEFDDLTAPSSRGYSGLQTEVAVWDISASGPTMTANLDVTFSRPLLEYYTHYFEDPGGDDDGIPDPGEIVDMFIYSTNLWKTTTDVYLTISCSNPQVVFNNDTSYIDEITSGEIHLNYEDPINFYYPAGSQPTIADFYINYSCEGGAFTFAETVSVDFGPKQVLIVDDDANYQGYDYTHYYTTALESLRIPHEVHHKDTQGSPSAAILGDYPMVCWYTGDDRAGSILVHDDIVALQSYLDVGGRLFFTGQDIAEKLSQTADSLFLVNYLGARYTGSSSIEPPFVRGVDDDPIGDGISLVLNGTGTAANQRNPDNLEPVPEASVSFIYDTLYSTGEIAGVTYARGGFKTVFWAFGFEAVNPTWPELGLSRTEILADILYWLVGLSTGILEEEDFVENDGRGNTVPTKYTLCQNYPNPFNGRTVIEYSVAPGQSGEITLDIINILGRRVTTIFAGTVTPGRHRVTWDGRDDHGRSVASGVYFYRLLDRDGTSQSRRMVYLK
ncbi:M6 family metalloprotease domain-containing protein [Candidatus Zixiibacteriota bacterium]